MKQFTVYAHLNSTNGKMYVGITSQKPTNRWCSGTGYRAQERFWNAIQKYGWDSFEHAIVASGLCESDAKNFEILLIRLLKTDSPLQGYNMTAGGTGTCGWVPDIAWRHKISVANKGKIVSEETRKKISRSRFNIALSEEHKRKISIAGKGRAMSANHARRIGIANMKPICQVTTDTNEVIAVWPSATEIHKSLGFLQSAISQAVTGRRAKAYGYVWKYEKEMV